MNDLMLDQTQPAKALPSLMETDDVAALLHVSRSLLAKWRMLGRGPRYMKVGRRILYECAEVTLWLKSQRRASTLG